MKDCCLENFFFLCHSSCLVSTHDSKQISCDVKLSTWGRNFLPKICILTQNRKVSGGEERNFQIWFALNTPQPPPPPRARILLPRIGTSLEELWLLILDPENIALLIHYIGMRKSLQWRRYNYFRHVFLTILRDSRGTRQWTSMLVKNFAVPSFLPGWSLVYRQNPLSSKGYYHISFVQLE